MIRSLCVLTFALAYTVLAGGPMLLFTMASGNSDPIYHVGIFGARMAARLAGARVSVQGREKIPEHRTVVFMANHQSNCDPPALMGLLPPVLILVKKEFLRVPILGRAMRLRGFIAIDRKCREKSRRAIDDAAKLLAEGYSFLVFPEGTRSADGRLLPFKKGGFIMAIKAAAPIVPVSISGSFKIMSKGKLAMRPGVVRITFHNPVETQGFTLEQREHVEAAVRGAILSGLGEEERPLRVAAS